MRAFALVVCLGLAGPLLAWSNAGHMTVVKLAWDQLGAKERQTLFDLLKNHPHWDKYFQSTPGPSTASEIDFRIALAGTWADWLRGYAKNKDPEAKKIYLFHKGPRHYVNWPFVKPADADLFKDPLPGPDPKDDVIRGIDAALDELKSTEKFSSKYRAVSLCWLLHLVGDIHQPLHNITYFSKYSKEGDQGGNLFWVKDRGTPVRLHAYWDNLLGVEDSYTAYAAAYDHAMTNVARLTRPDFAEEKFVEELKHLTPAEWSKEGFDLAVKAGYRNGDLRGWLVTYSRDTDEEHAKAPELPDDYRPAALIVADRQAALAGYRLRDLLKIAAKATATARP